MSTKAKSKQVLCAGPMLRMTGLLLFSTILSMSPALKAQDARGDILGRVTDPSGAVIAGATVRAVNVGTNVATDATTNQTGDFRLPFLSPGAYGVTVEAAGFKTYTQEGITVQVNQQVTLNIALTIGASSESVKVVAEAPLVDAASASVGGVVDTKRISDLPLTHGNPILLASLTPGVSNLVTNGWTRPFDNGTASSISINGSRSGTNDFTIDGAPNTGGENGNVSFTPPTAVVEEFKIQTATFDTANGYSTGAVVNISLKSGGNQFHANLHEFFQNTDLNANAFFSNAASRARDVSHMNRYGGMASGPVWIPRLYNGKNKTFWMFGYEGIIDYYPRNSIVTGVPTAAQRNGDFSALLNLGSKYQIYDPLTTTSIGNGRYSRQPLPNNVIPASRIDSVSQKVLSLLPSPNLAGTGDGTNNYTSPNSDNDHYYAYVLRFDHSMGDRDRLSFRGNMSHRNTLGQHSIDNGASGYDQFRDCPGVGLDEVHIFGPELVLNVRASFSMYRDDGINPTNHWDISNYGYSQAFLGQIAADPRGFQLPGITISNIYAISQSVSQNTHNTIASLSGALTKMWRAHTIKFGSELRAYRLNTVNFGFSSGAFTYDSTYTNGPNDNSAGAPNGQGLASFLMGIPSSGSIASNDSGAASQKIPSFFVQDDWKASSKLTLSFGLRYELSLPLTERYNRSVRGFDAASALPITSAVLAAYAANPQAGIAAGQFNVNGGLLFAGANGQPRGLWNANTADFAPRFGLAYQFSPRTVLRAGYGIFYDLDRQSLNQTGFNRTTTMVTTPDNGITYTGSSANPFPSGFSRANGSAQGLSTYLGQSVSFFNPNLKTPYMQRWQASLQRQLSSSTMFELAYVGNRGTRLRTTRALDAIPRSYYSTLATRDQQTINYMTALVANPFYPLLPGTSLASSTVARSQLLRPFPQFTGIGYNTNEGYSWYHSLQARAERRFNGGLTVSAAYTWSKFMEATGFLNDSDPRPERVISDQDRTNRIVITTLYELPFGQGKPFLNSAKGIGQKLVGGWQVQGIYQGQSGQAIGFGDALITGDSSTINLPNGDRTVARWFNTKAFDTVSAEQRAWDIRTLPTRFSGIRGDGLNNFDLSLFKNTTLSEHAKLQFRAEATNAFNHAQFSTPNTTVTSSAFGTVSGANTFPRIIQLGLRLMF